MDGNLINQKQNTTSNFSFMTAILKVSLKSTLSCIKRSSILSSLLIILEGSILKFKSIASKKLFCILT